MSSAAKYLTVDEAARVLTRVADQACSTRQIHYLLVAGGLGTDVQARKRGQTRLYGPFDLALMLLSLRLRQEGVSASVTRVVLTYLRDDVIRAWRAGSALAVAVNGLRGTLEPALKAPPKGTSAWVPLRAVWHGLEAEIQKVRSSQPNAWMWREIPIHSVPRP